MLGSWVAERHPGMVDAASEVQHTHGFHEVGVRSNTGGGLLFSGHLACGMLLEAVDSRRVEKRCDWLIAQLSNHPNFPTAQPLGRFRFWMWLRVPTVHQPHPPGGRAPAACHASFPADTTNGALAATPA